MMPRTGVTLRRILGDRRLYLLLAVLIFLFWASQRMGMAANYRHDVFETMIARQAAHPNQAARSLGVEGQFETMEQVWDAFVDDPERAEYYYRMALLSPFFPGLLANFLLSFWLIGRSLERRQASLLLLHGAGRGAAFRQLLFPYLGGALLLRWGFFALDFLCLPIHAEYFPPGYLRTTVLTCLLMTGADAAFFAVLAFALPPAAALGADLGAAAALLLLPRPLRGLLPLGALCDESLWTPSAFSESLPAAAVCAGAVLIVSLLASWLLFRKKDLD